MSNELITQDSGVIAKVEIDTQIATAKAYPRDPKKCIEGALFLATLDDETSESCFYVLARKDKDGTRKDISGPSIRLAEIFASSWGNIHAASRIIENDGKFITSEAVAWDLEKNVRISVQTKRSIQFGNNKSGYYTANQDMQQTIGNAACSIALRNAIFKIIPKAFINNVLEKAKSNAIGNQESLNKKRNSLFDRFKALGIEKEVIFEFFNKTSISDFNADDVQVLIGMGTAIKEGIVKIDDAFKITDGEEKIDARERIRLSIESKKKQENDGEYVKPDLSGNPY